MSGRTRARAMHDIDNSDASGGIILPADFGLLPFLHFSFFNNTIDEQSRRWIQYSDVTCSILLFIIRRRLEYYTWNAHDVNERAPVKQFGCSIFVRTSTCLLGHPED